MTVPASDVVEGILDYARESLGSLNQQIGVNDRLRVDEYLTSIREIERRQRQPGVDDPGVRDLQLAEQVLAS